MTIQALTGNETLEELDAMLDAMDANGEQGNDGNPMATDNVDNSVASAATAVDANPNPNGEQESENEPPAKKGILAKDGEHIIPFEVLEAERRNNQRITQENEALQQRLAESEQAKRLLELRDKQLEKLGVAPSDLPENLEITEAQLDELCDNYPEIGPLISGLVAKVNAIQPQAQQQAAPPPATNSVMDDIKANADLNAWHSERGDKWNVALDIDDRLMEDPNWNTKPQAERFAEVARRTKAVFGESSATPQHSAKEQEAALESQLPASPSALGSPNTHSANLVDQAANMDNAALQTLFKGMTNDQIDDLLAQADF